MNMNRTRKSVSVRAGRFEFLKVNAETWEWRDLYHWILALNWPQFAALILGGYTAINLVFAALYSIGGDCIAGMGRGSFLDAFFLACKRWPPSGTATCIHRHFTATWLL
jgi:inward rectifier potassium channel